MYFPKVKKGMEARADVDSFCCFCGVMFYQNAHNMSSGGWFDFCPAAIDDGFRWLSDIRMLGWNRDALSYEKTFFTGASRPHKHGTFISEPSDNPDYPSQNENSACPPESAAVRGIKAYAFKNGESRGLAFVPFYPFHLSCLKVFEAFFDEQAPGGFDREVLYTTFDSLCGDSKLTIDYGEMVPYQTDRFSRCQGSESFLHDPDEIPELMMLYRSLPHVMSEQEYQSAAHGGRVSLLNRAQAYQETTLFSLPVELIEKILIFLPVKSIQQFQATCTNAHAFRLSQQFWKYKLLIDMPFLYDLPATSDTCEIDWASSYRQLHSAAHPSSSSTIRGLANRRRVWGLCAQIFACYHKRLITTMSISYPKLNMGAGITAAAATTNT